MPKIKITKQLNRPDGGTITANSIADSNPRMIEESVGGKVFFPFKLHFSQSAMDSGKPKVPACTEFPTMRVVKQCTQAEWDAMNDDADAGALVSGWMLAEIIAVVGTGNAEIVI